MGKRVSNIFENTTIKNQETPFEILFEQAGVGMVFSDLDGKILKTNDYFVSMIGYDYDELNGYYLKDISFKADQEKSYVQIRKLKDGVIDKYKIRKRYIHKNGTLIWSEVDVSGIYDEEGELTSLFAIVKDISETKYMEAKLEEQSVLFSIAMDNFPYRVFIKSPTGEYIACNSAFAEDVNKTPEGIVGLTDYDIYTKEIASKYRNDDKRIIKEGKGDEYVEEYITKGEERYILTHKSPIYRNGKNIGIIGTFIDITNTVDVNKNLFDQARSHRKKAKTSTEMVEMIFETSPDIMCVINTAGIIEKVNQSWHTQLGWSDKDLIGSHYKDFVVEKDVSKLEEINKKMLVDPRAKNYYVELGTRHKNGGIELFQVSLRNVEQFILVTAHNITLQRKTEEYLLESKLAAEKSTIEAKKAKATAEKANKLKAEFIANLSHEIRTPLNAVIGFSEVLEEELNDKRLIKHVKSINTAGNTLINLISDILDLSKLEAGMVPITYEKINVEHFLKEVKMVFQHQLDVKQLFFNIEIDENIPKILLMDKLRMKQILINLVGNAVKFTHSGGVTVRLKSLKSSEVCDRINLALSVTDTGIGIPMEDQDSIFMSFRQQSDTISREYGGTGLGLAICKKLAEVMGGSISVESEVGVGSTFKVIFCGVASQTEEKVEKESTPMFVGYFPTANILMVDDEELNRLLMEEVLDSRCKSIDCVPGTSQALSLAKVKQYDLVIVDLIMPGIDGVGCANLLREIPGYENIPIICYSANANNNDKQKELREHFNDYLVKPIKINKLLEVLGKYI